jgi:hypothetical protein
MSCHPVTKLRESRWDFQEEEELAQAEEEAKEQEQAEVTGRVTRRLLPTMPNQLVSSSGLVVERERNSKGKSLGESLKGCYLLCPVD